MTHIYYNVADKLTGQFAGTIHADDIALIEVAVEHMFAVALDPTFGDDPEFIYVVDGSPPVSTLRPTLAITNDGPTVAASPSAAVTFSNVPTGAGITVVDDNGTAAYVMDASNVFRWQPRVVSSAVVSFDLFPAMVLRVPVEGT